MIPANLAANPGLDRWVAFERDGIVRLSFGKVEYGQGVMTALAQIGAEELDVAMSRVRVDEQTTTAGPDEGMTVGSMSIETSGAAVRAACAEARARFLAAAADKLACGVDHLSVSDGAVLRDGRASGETYWTLADRVDLTAPATGAASPKSPDAYRIVGDSHPRRDLPPKVFGAAFIHDLAWPGMMHARVLRQPGPRARLVSLDEARVRRAAGGDIDIVRDGAFVAFLAARESVAGKALEAAEANAVWEGARNLTPDLSEAAALRSMPSSDTEMGAPPPGPANRRLIKATYSKPYLFHGSMGPCCALAQFKDNHLTVWTHAQGVHPVRQLIARAIGVSVSDITVHHAQGPGNYGHNGADDAALDAAAIAIRRPGPPIRVQWRREDDFGHEPVGPAMLIDMSAELDAAGMPADFTTEIWSGPHVNRGRALAQSALPRPAEAGSASPSAPAAAAMRFSGASLNAIPSYDIPAARVKEHLVSATPVRTSALRGLGGPPNEYAGECFIDELADAAGRDPLAYRLSMLSNARGRVVLERAAEMASWARREPGGAGKGLGLGFSIHRGRGALVAVVARVSVETEVRVEHMWCVADCGLIINPDGARSQIEGGMVMAASWALKEQVRLAGAGVASVTWDDYPILRFDEVPLVEIELIDAPGEPALGIGEISSGPALAAIGNAVAHALGARIRHLPYTRERIAATLLGS